MNSFAKKARIVWRTKSVEVTRVIPSRYATSVATVDLPVPVPPPTSRITGRSSSCRSRKRCEAADRARAGLLAEQVDGEVAHAVEVDRSRARGRRGRPRFGARARTPSPRRRRRASRTRAISPFEYGVRSPRKSILPCRRSLIPPPPLASRMQLVVERELLAGRRSDVAAREHDVDSALARRPRRRRRSPPPSARRGRRRRRPRSSSRRSACRSARLPETCTTSAPCSSSRCLARPGVRVSGRGREERDAPARRRRRPAAGRSDCRDHARAELGDALAQLLPAAIPRRPSSARRGRRSGAGTRSGSRSRPPRSCCALTTRTRRLVATAAARRRSRRRGRARARARAAMRGAGGDVRGGDGAREPAAAAAAADRCGTPRERRRLEVVGRGVAAGVATARAARRRRRHLGDLRLRRAAAAHRDDDDLALAREQLRRVRR